MKTLRLGRYIIWIFLPEVLLCLPNYLGAQLDTGFNLTSHSYAAGILLEVLGFGFRVQRLTDEGLRADYDGVFTKIEYGLVAEPTSDKS